MFDVLEQPYHETLYEYMALQDIDRLERIKRDAESIRDASYMSYAFNEPSKLAEVWKEKEAVYEMEQNPYLIEEEKKAALDKAIDMIAAMEGKEFRELTDAELEHMARQGLIPPLQKK